MRFLFLPLLFTFNNFLPTLSFETFQQRVSVNSSELCIIPISPSHFNWDKTPGSVNEIEYSARIAAHPDLPSWLHYSYEKFNSIGFIYGVPPSDRSSIDLELVAFNRYESYAVRRMLISLDIKKKYPLEFVVEIKIDNLNVKDLCSPRRLQFLLNVFSDQLGWRMKDGGHVKPVYMISAQFFEENRAPLKPNEPEGVVIHLGSDRDFSKELKKVQIETSPLWKLRPCPREMKRTSVEIHFRKHNFLIDWCSFRLRTIPQWNLGGSDDRSSEENDDVNEQGEQDVSHTGDIQDEPFILQTEVPQRSYTTELILSTVLPGSIGIGIGLVIIALLWVDRDDDTPINDDDLFFEGAFRSLRSFFRIKSKSEGDFYRYQESEPDAGTIVLTQDRKNNRKLQEELGRDRERDMSPLPPQYEETRKNGSPSPAPVVYAV